MLGESVRVRLDECHKTRLRELQMQTGFNGSQIIRWLIEAADVKIVTTFSTNNKPTTVSVSQADAVNGFGSTNN